jgi:hypothetical protein
LPARVHDLLDDGEQVDGRAGEPVGPPTVALANEDSAIVMLRSVEEALA